jgi:prepilin-type processing-associated H-X9-DG protein
MNYMDPWMGNNDYPSDGNWWGTGSSQCLMSPTCDDESGTESAVSQTASTILIAPRPNWYHEWCSGSATNQFYASGEYIDKPVQGSMMFGNGSNYSFCDGHVKFAPPGATTKAQGSQVGTLPPSYWPTGDSHYWPWPMGMWDKRQ